MIIHLGHSPDADDAFMFWAMAEGLVDTPLQFEHVLRDIQTLNEWAREGKLEFTAMSVHNLAYVADRYVVLNQGGSFGDGYGPMLVAREPIPLDELRRYTIAVPGYLTSAYLALRLYLPDAQTIEMPFDAIMPAVQRSEVPVGLLIHEGQLTHQQEGLHLLLDLGIWWSEQTGGLPLPLGVNAIRSDLPIDLQREIARVFRESIRLGLENRDAAMCYAMQFGRGIDPQTADRFVGMYVNALTLDMGERGRRAITEFLTRGAAQGITPQAQVRFLE
ncbi:MAG: ABC transporter substrate-binding protein [Fimbriimonadales bacterium]|nr:MAG: ABC transporter substrate-binding protein [Fimbriimonadales bacterium]GIV08959.1 MAG: ABC transporter substrate-binding protein [Fimbriimonadales bacterium]